MNGLRTTHGYEIGRRFEAPRPEARREGGASGLRAASQALSDYLFGGDGVARVWNQAEIRKVVAFLRDHRGIASLEEIMTLTGRRGDEAGRWTTLLLRDYDGEPAVTDGGAVLYRFENLARAGIMNPATAGPSGDDWKSQLDPNGEERYLRSEIARVEQRAPMSLGNAMTLLSGILFGTIAATNFGSAALSMPPESHSRSAALLSGGMRSVVAGAHIAHALPMAALAVGFLPAGIASTLFVLHLASARKSKRLIAEMRERYLRKQVYYRVLANPMSVDPVEIKIGSWGGAIQSSRQLVARILDELAADYDAEIEESDRGGYLYHIPEIERRTREIESVRLATSPQ